MRAYLYHVSTGIFAPGVVLMEPFIPRSECRHSRFAGVCGGPWDCQAGVHARSVPTRDVNALIEAIMSSQFMWRQHTTTPGFGIERRRPWPGT